MKEVELYGPLKEYLLFLGYNVFSEVQDVDVVAQKDDELMIIEMKTSFNMQLIYQLSERLKITSNVYAYIPLPKGGRWPKSYKKMCGVLKRLNCGLMTLDLKKNNDVKVEFKPKSYQLNKNSKKKKELLRELNGRSIDLNQGGTTREFLFTAYKEKMIRIAMYLSEHGASSTKELRENLDIKTATQILNKNYFRWFDRVSQGVYQLTPEFEFFRIKYQKQIDQLWQK